MKKKKPTPNPRFYPDRPETHRHPDTGGLGHGGFPARNQVFPFRMTFYEKNELYRLAKTHQCTSAYLIRDALERMYPDIFVGTNHNIRKKRPRVLKDTKTVIIQSLADGKITAKDASALNMSSDIQSRSINEDQST